MIFSLIEHSSKWLMLVLLYCITSQQTNSWFFLSSSDGSTFLSVFSVLFWWIQFSLGFFLSCSNGSTHLSVFFCLVLMDPLSSRFFSVWAKSMQTSNSSYFRRCLETNQRAINTPPSLHRCQFHRAIRRIIRLARNETCMLVREKSERARDFNLLSLVSAQDWRNPCNSHTFVKTFCFLCSLKPPGNEQAFVFEKSKFWWHTWEYTITGDGLVDVNSIHFLWCL